MIYMFANDTDNLNNTNNFNNTNTLNAFNAPNTLNALDNINISNNDNHVNSKETPVGNAVTVSNYEPVTRNIIITEKIPHKKTTNRRSTSLYTSQGKHKATPADAITNRKDILRLKNYFLYESANDRKPYLRTRNHLLFVLGISSSLRVSDLINLDIGQVLTRTIATNPETHKKEYHFTIKDHIELIDTKTRKSNLIKVSSEAKKALQIYFKDYITYCNKKSFPIDPTHPLFQAEGSVRSMEQTGKPIRLGMDGVYILLNKAQKALNLPYHLSTHCLRKTFAYWMLELHPNDANAIAVLMKALNHSSLEATNHYTGRTQKQKDKAFDDISELFNADSIDTDIDILSNDTNEKFTAEDIMVINNSNTSNNTYKEDMSVPSVSTVCSKDDISPKSTNMRKSVSHQVEDEPIVEDELIENTDEDIIEDTKADTINTKANVTVDTNIDTNVNTDTNTSNLQTALKALSSLSPEDMKTLIELMKLSAEN